MIPVTSRQPAARRVRTRTATRKTRTRADPYTPRKLFPVVGVDRAPVRIFQSQNSKLSKAQHSQRVEIYLIHAWTPTETNSAAFDRSHFSPQPPSRPDRRAGPASRRKHNAVRDQRGRTGRAQARTRRDTQGALRRRSRRDRSGAALWRFGSPHPLVTRQISPRAQDCVTRRPVK